MNKKNLIIGTGPLAAYLSYELLKKKEKVTVTSRSKKKIYNNFKYLKIQKKIKFVRLSVKNKIEIEKLIKTYKPNKIFYFAGQSSLTKSIKMKKETFESHYNGTKNFIDILKKNNLKCKFFKANSGYIFKPKNGKIDFNCKFSKNKNAYIQAQQKTFKIINKYRKFNLSLFNLVFFQIESPLRKNDFFIKKVCLGSKNKNKITVGNIEVIRDYSWITEVIKAIILTSSLEANNYIISAGRKMSGIEILNFAYKLNRLNYKKYFKISNKFLRENENKFLIGSRKNSNYLKRRFNFKFKIFKDQLIRKMYNSL